MSVMFFQRKSSVDVVGANRLQEEGAMMLDVRTKTEFKGGHVPGATHVSLESLGQREDWIARQAKDRTVLVICRSGNRSARATHHLRRLGLDALNVRGGMMAWQRKGLPVKNGAR